MKLSAPLAAYHRITQYGNYLDHLPRDAPENISATMIADALEINDVVVRKDLACVSGAGKPKVGYQRTELARAVARFLGRDSMSEAALVGAGKLGQALLGYENFSKYGMRIILAFDKDPQLIGKRAGGVEIFSAEKIAQMCSRLGVKIGVITVPGHSAQSACDALIAGGARAVWNFAPVTLKVPEGVAVRNEDMAASLAILIKQMGG
ncbi:MAG: redox-sensing transcriptional repressor Rex [Oscillospiraceae bacterium]|nr:redox-sensing transcriptional repressor Rex [Oscillospiraceae bacterium]